MSIAYCDHCGEIITDSKYAPGQATLCVSCRGSAASSAASDATPSKTDDFAPTTAESELPGASLADAAPDPYAPSATMVMSVSDMQQVLAAEPTVPTGEPAATSAESSLNSAGRSGRSGSSVSQLACGLSTSSDLEPQSSFVDDPCPTPSSPPVEDDYSMAALLESGDLDLFSSDTVARRKAANRTGTPTSLSLVDDDEDAEGNEADFDPADLPGGDVEDGMSVFNETLRITGEFTTEARVPRQTTPTAPQHAFEGTAAPPTHATPTEVPIETPRASAFSPAQPPPSAALLTTAATPSPQGSTAIHEAEPGTRTLRIQAPPADDRITTATPAATAPPARVVTRPTVPPPPKPCVVVRGEKWQLLCLQCGSKLAVRSVTQRSRISCPRCSACVRIETDGTYEQLNTPTAVPGQRLAHVAGPSVPTPAPPTPDPVAPGLPEHSAAPPPSPSPLIPPPRMLHELAAEMALTSATEPTSVADRLQWSVTGASTPGWRNDLRDLGWLIVLAAPLTVGVLLATGTLPLDLEAPIRDLGDRCQTTVRDLLSRLGG